jgi:Domain of unknown function (DUF4129)
LRSSWPARLLPAFQVLAEGGWIAVVYAAAQALVEATPRIGPIELALLAWVGMAWARRSRWRSAAPEAIGLPVLALLGGAAGWFLAPDVRAALVAGAPLAALSLHLPGWIAGLAVIRGAAHADPEDDEVSQDLLLRWAVPGLALPWFVGQVLAPASARPAFTAAAFAGTMVFIGASFAAMGLARLEAVRAETGSDWRRSRTWLAVLAVTAAVLMVVGIPAAAFLGVPLQTLAAMLYGPIRLVFLLALLIMTPVILAAAALAEALRSILPKGVQLPTITLPNLAANPVEPTTAAPAIIFYVVVALIVILEVAIVTMVIYLRWQERRRLSVAILESFEERAIVIPPAEAPPPARRDRARASGSHGTGPEGSYLAALDLLAGEERWARHPHETPAVHARRVRAAGLSGSGIDRLAVAYQLVRYAGRTVTRTEAGRAARRLATLRARLRSGTP